MHYIFSSGLLLFLYSPHALACIATAPTTPTTTTIVPETTTAVETTTVVMTACTSCVATDIDFLESDGTPESIDATFREETADPVTGCSRLTAICTADVGLVAFMEFNVGQGGPVENMNESNVVEAALSCRDGLWYYRNERVISTVSCRQAPIG